MRWRTSAAIAGGALVGLAAIAIACSTGEPASPHAVAAPENPAVDAGPVRAPFGLDVRPANPTCVAPPRPPATRTPVQFERVFDGMSLGFIMGMAQPPGDGSRWFVATVDGYITSFPTDNPPAAPAIVANLKTDPTYPCVVGGESGLFGIAFHPRFAENGQLFATYTTNGGPLGVRSVVVRLTSSDGGKTFGPPTPILGPFDQPSFNHKGGGIAFGPDGFLYVSFGDGKDPGSSANGQSLTSFFSKVLRIDVDSPPEPGRAYAIPSDNPFKNGGGEPATFARGFRNPYRMSFDRGTGDLWVGDVGEAIWEEVNVAKRGGNYGWPCRDGPDAGFLACAKPGFVEPAYAYRHALAGTSPESRAVVGGFVYRGRAIPDLAGTYVFGDWVQDEIWGLSFDPSTGAPIATRLNTGGPEYHWTGFTEDADGELYAFSSYGIVVFKLVPAGPTPASSFPDRLSKTGCVDAANPTRPSAGAIPYAVNAGQWSDGATKERFLALPEGTSLRADDAGHLDLPAGGVLMETLSLSGKRIETRLLVRHDDGEWAGYSYEWLDDQSDAVLLPAGKTKRSGSQPWSFPSRSDCVQCHSTSAGRALGLELAQLDRDFVYGNRISNQLATLDHVGLLARPWTAAPAYPEPLGAGPLEARARAYLHTNCSACHRPGAGRGASIDLRFGAATSALCNASSMIDELGVDGAKLVAPGSVQTSLLSLRAHATTYARMPPLGSTIVDEDGLRVLDAWIGARAGCP